MVRGSLHRALCVVINVHVVDRAGIIAAGGGVSDAALIAFLPDISLALRTNHHRRRTRLIIIDKQFNIFLFSNFLAVLIDAYSQDNAPQLNSEPEANLLAAIESKCDSTAQWALSG